MTYPVQIIGHAGTNPGRDLILQATQLERLGVRDNVSLEECRKAVSAQMPAEDKVAFM
jgi:hypothetical protein